MRHVRTLLAATALAASVLQIPAAHAQDSRLSVVASFSIIGDFAKAVGGDRIKLRTLVGPNSDAHVYEPRPSDAKAMAAADVVLVNGLSFEGFMERLAEVSQTSAKVTVLTDGADVLNDPAGGHYHYFDGKAVFHATPNDPHAWQSVSNAKVYVRNIAQAFCEVDRAGCTQYETNAAAYSERLADLDEEIRKTIFQLPENKRVAVVAHNAFRYFERDHGVSFLSPQGITTESEASAADVASMILEIRAKHASAVFSENISDARLVEQIASEAGLSVGGVLFSDALSPEDGPASSYIEMMRHNTQTMFSALKGK